MEEKIQQAINQALREIASSEGEHPDKVVIRVISDSALSGEAINRIVEGLNTNLVVKKIQSGQDIEKDFPICDAEKVKEAFFSQKIVEKKASILSKFPVVVTEPRDFKKEYYQSKSVVKQSGLKTTTQGVLPDSLYKKSDIEKQKDRDVESLVKTSACRTRKYLEKFSEYLQYDRKFMAEIRYLYPTSEFLKVAGLQGGEKKIPYSVEPEHVEFYNETQNWERLNTLEKIGGIPVLQAFLKKNAAANLEGEGGSFLSKKVFPFFGRFGEALQLKGILDKKRSHGALNKYISHEFREMDSPTANYLRDAQVNVETTLDNIRRVSLFKSILKEPEFSSTDKHKMLNIFKSMSDLAPNLTLNQGVVKSVLRAANAAGIDDVTPELASTLVKSEKLYANPVYRGE